MKKAKRTKEKKTVQPKAAAQELWAHVKQHLKVDEALKALAPGEASRSAFKVKESAD